MKMIMGGSQKAIQWLVWEVLRKRRRRRVGFCSVVDADEEEWRRRGLAVVAASSSVSSGSSSSSYVVEEEKIAVPDSVSYTFPSIHSALRSPPLVWCLSVNSRPAAAAVASSSSHSFSAQVSSAPRTHNSSLLRVISTPHHIPLSASWFLSSTRCALFLSSPLSLLSQLATPFFCTGDDLQRRDGGKVKDQSRYTCRQEGHAQAQNKLHAVSSTGEVHDFIGCRNRGALHSERTSIPYECHLERKESTLLKRVESESDVFNLPNTISFGRLLSGPCLAWLILQGSLQPALMGLVFAGASDWLDGFLARRKGINSVLGSHLDPLADKVLVGCVALSMAHTGLLNSALVALVIARDGALVVGAFFHRAYSLDWTWTSWREFFDVGDGGVEKVEPLFISKVNTVLQLALVGTALLQPALGIVDTHSLVPFLSCSVAFTTCASWLGYGVRYLWKQPPSRRGYS